MSWSKEALGSFAALYAICLILVTSRLYTIFVVHAGFIWGDVTNHFYVAGMRILEGGNPYDSVFITHPPLMLLLFAAILAIHNEPYAIGLVLMSFYFVIPWLSYRLSAPYLSARFSLLFSWLVTLNPLTIYASVHLIDDDPLIMLGVMTVFYLYPRDRTHASVVGAILGGFKFIPLVVVSILVLCDRELQVSFRIKHLILQACVFGSIMLVGFLLWGSVALTRLIHYCSYVGLDYPSMSLYYSYFTLIGGVEEGVLRILALAIMGSIILAVLLYSNRKGAVLRKRMNSLVLSALLAIYMSNVTNSYLHFIWVLPFLTLEILIIAKNVSCTLPSLGVLVMGISSLNVFGFLTAEWANYTWAYEPDMVIYSHIATLFAFVFLILITLASYLRPQEPSKPLANACKCHTAREPVWSE